MQRVMLDTSIVRYWYEGHAKWGPLIEREFLEIDKRGAAAKLISAVTAQEFLVFPLILGGDEAVRAEDWLLKRFGTPLLFSGRIAARAARLQAAVGRPAKERPGSVDRERVDRWFRDASIMATAIEVGVTTLIVADGDFPRWRGEFAGDLVQLALPAEPP